MLRWLKSRSRSKPSETRQEANVSDEIGSSAHGKYRLEPLEPRVLLSADSILGAVAGPALLNAITQSANGNALVEQVEANVVQSNTSDVRSGADAGSVSDVSVAWPAGWQASAASDAKTDTISDVKTDAVGDTETDTVGDASSDADSTIVGDAGPQNSASELALSDDAQPAQFERAETTIASHQNSDNERDSSLVNRSDDDIITTLVDTTQLPRGPPDTSQLTSALIAQESIHINELSPTDSSTHNEGGLVAFYDAPVSEVVRDVQARGPPAADDSHVHESQYLRSDSSVAATAQNSAPSLTDQALAPALEEALRIWKASGIASALIERLAQLEVRIADLPDGLLGESDGNTISIDRDAAGQGWFVDPTPTESTEFGIAHDDARLLADASSEAFGRIDLVTVLVHEVGHTLGFGHGSDLAVMSEVLAPGQRVLLAAAKAQAAETVADRTASAAALHANSIDTLQADASDTGPITFRIFDANDNAIPDVEVSGAASGNGVYEDVGTIVGSADSDDVLVVDIDHETGWTITGPNAGTVVIAGFASVQFAYVGNLTGWDPLESTCRHASLSIL